MNDLAEELVALWFERQGYFLIRNICFGKNQEIDLLVKRGNECAHVEVQVSDNPLGMLGSGGDLKKNKSPRAMGYLYWKKKFSDPEVRKLVKQQLGPKHSRKLVLGKYRSEKNIDVLRDKGVEIIHFGDIVSDLLNKDFGSLKIHQASRYRQIMSFIVKD